MRPVRCLWSASARVSATESMCGACLGGFQRVPVKARRLESRWLPLVPVRTRVKRTIYMLKQCSCELSSRNGESPHSSVELSIVP